MELTYLTSLTLRFCSRLKRPKKGLWKIELVINGFPPSSKEAFWGLEDVIWVQQANAFRKNIPGGKSQCTSSDWILQCLPLPNHTPFPPITPISILQNIILRDTSWDKVQICDLQGLFLCLWLSLNCNIGSRENFHLTQVALGKQKINPSGSFSTPAL